MTLRHTSLKHLQRDLGALTVRAKRLNRGAAVPLARKAAAREIDLNAEFDRWATSAKRQEILGIINAFRAQHPQSEAATDSVARAYWRQTALNDCLRLLRLQFRAGFEGGAFLNPRFAYYSPMADIFVEAFLAGERLAASLLAGKRFSPSRKDRVSDTFVNLADAVDDMLSLLSTLEADPNATSDQRAMGRRLRSQLEALRLTLQMAMQGWRSAGARSFARKAAADSFDDAVRSAIDALADAYELILAAVRLVPAGAPPNTATQLRDAAERIAQMRSLIFNVSAIAQRRDRSALASKQTPAGAFADWWGRVGQYDAQEICRRSQAAELHQPGVLADIRRWCEEAFQQGAANRPHTAMGSWPDPALDDLEEDAYQAGRRFRSLPPYA